MINLRNKPFNFLPNNTTKVLSFNLKSLISRSKEIYHGRDAGKISFIIAFTLHLMVIFSGFILAKMAANNHQIPVLSFSMTFANAASNPNNISISSVSQRKSAETKKLATNKQDSQPAQSQKIENLNQIGGKTSDKKTDLFDSKAQTAVFANTTAIFDAAYLQNPSPHYPPLSRRLKEQGKVLLNVYVNALGKVEKVEVEKSSGFDRLDDAAIKTVKNWNFIAAKKDHQLVASTVQVPINFILE